MNRHSLIPFALLLSLSCAGLVACNNSNQEPPDLAEFVKTLQAKLNQKKVVAPPKETFAQPVVYEGNNQPSPFLQTNMKEGLRVDDASKEPLEMFPLDAIRLVGVVLQRDKKTAILATPDNAAYQVTLGTKLGDHYGRIVNIEQDQVVVMEQMPPDESGIVKQRPVTLRLKDIK